MARRAIYAILKQNLITKSLLNTQPSFLCTVMISKTYVAAPTGPLRGLGGPRTNTKSGVPPYGLCEGGLGAWPQKILRFTCSKVCSGGSLLVTCTVVLYCEEDAGMGLCTFTFTFYHSYLVCILFGMGVLSAVLTPFLSLTLISSTLSAFDSTAFTSPCPAAVCRSVH